MIKNNIYLDFRQGKRKLEDLKGCLKGTWRILLHAEVQA